MSKNQPELALENTKEDWQRKKFLNPKHTIRVATLFSGIGAIEHALERLKLNKEIVFACDNDPAVKKSYFENYNILDKHWHDDICELNAKKYKYKIDLLVGGSPCQSFSMVGKRGGLEDTRGTLFYEFARIIDESKPKVFIFENVKGLLSHDEGNTWQIIQNVFNELGYFFKTPEILNSKHFGVPQNRNRIFVVGFRKTKWKDDFEYPRRIELESTMQDYLEDYVDSNFYLKEKGVKFVTSLKNQIKSYTQVNGDVALCQKANQQFNWHGDFVFEQGIVDIQERLVISGPSSLYQIAGEVDLKNETIDGEMYLTLPVSENIPWLGLLTSNIPLAVGAYLFDRIFGDEVSSLTSAIYTLNGNWEGLEPQFKQAFGSVDDLDFNGSGAAVE